MKFLSSAAIAATLLACAIPFGAAGALALDRSTVSQSISGTASWYGGRFHGRTTANGEQYNMHELTAAHRSLPFGTLVRVINKDNGRSVIVRINDRGPYVGRRIIDLSQAAASRIGMVNAGIASVVLEVLG